MNPNIEKSPQLLKNLKFCVIDLETTGGTPEVDRIIEIGLVKVENLKIVEERSYIINPKREIPEFIQRLTQIKNDDVKSAPTLEEVIDEIIHFIGDTICVAHNTSFDIPFLNARIKALGRPTLDNKVLCTNVMTKYLLPDIMSSNLPYMSEVFNIEHKEAHRAIEDARATAMLLLKYLDLFEQKGLRKVNQLYYPRNRFELDRFHIENESEWEWAKEKISHIQSSLLISVKGSHGVILRLYPVKNVRSDIEWIEKDLADLPWEQITFRLTGTFFEALNQLQLQFLKIVENKREEAFKIIEKHIPISSDQTYLNKDFLVIPHLIYGQFSLYSFMHFSTYSQLTFKFPSHKKKLQQFLFSQVVRFDSHQKRIRKWQVAPSLVEWFKQALAAELEEQGSSYLFLSTQEIKDGPQGYSARLDDYTSKHQNEFQFPQIHF